MQRSVRYEPLSTEETEPSVPVDEVRIEVSASNEGPAPPDDSLPSYEDASREETEGATGGTSTESSDPKIPEPPSYNIATTLPSYEEAEETKQREDEEAARNRETNRVRDAPIGDIELGTDGIFLCTFVLAFIFNWVGLMISLCFSHSIAGRMGALSGFGLSLVKWVAIVKHHNLAHTVAAGDSWIWWMLIVMGLLMFFRGCLQYVRIKYQWNTWSQIRERVYLSL